MRAHALILSVLVAFGARAQFGGGNGRGDAAISFQPTPIPSNIFSGGNGRGDVVALFQPTPIPSNIFSGGNGRGDVVALFEPTSMPSNIFSGGNGRGDVVALFQPTPIPSNIFSGGNGRGDVAARFDRLSVLLALKGFLEGPYNSSTGSMSDALRTAGIMPLTEPFTALGYAHTGGGGGETVTSTVLSTAGNNAIVDWVVVEVRSSFTPSVVLATRSALIQRDGDVVAADGISAIRFNLTPGDYHVALRHRNHLGVMTLAPVTLATSPTPLDLTNASTPTYGTQARKSVTGAFPAEVLWAGDVTFNGQLKYTGANSDRESSLLTAIGGVVPTNTVNGQYRQEDVNLDGTVKYTGLNNDRDLILTNIGGVVPTNVRNAQLP